MPRDGSASPLPGGVPLPFGGCALRPGVSAYEQASLPVIINDPLVTVLVRY